MGTPCYKLIGGWLRCYYDNVDIMLQSRMEQLHLEERYVEELFELVCFGKPNSTASWFKIINATPLQRTQAAIMAYFL